MKLPLKLSALVLVPILYFVATTGFKKYDLIMERAVSVTESPIIKDFVNLIFTDTYFGRANSSDPRAIENNIYNFRDSLHFNSVHVYGYDTLGGGFNSNLNWYSTYVSGLMNTVKDNGLRGYFGRSKIEKLCYGQRLEYEAEGGNNGFSYQRRSANVTSDSGKSVVHACLPDQTNCPETDATPRYLCDSIYENLQHGDLIDFTQLDTGTWFIKPMMRIDSSIVDLNPEDSIVRIDVINYRGALIKSVKIKARNFGKFDAQSQSYFYSGNYKNIYDFSLESGNINLEITGESYSPSGLNYGMRYNTWPEWKDSCKVDFKIWWYGKVEVWFDKMTVDDEVGNRLFNADSSIRNPMKRKIVEEVSEFSDNIGNGYFYIDELAHSNIPSVKRVLEIIKQTNPDAKVDFGSTNLFNVRSYKNNNFGFRFLLSEINSESFHADAHEIIDILPDNLDSSKTDPHINPNWIKSKETYNVYLQKKYFGDKSRETGIDTIENHWAENIPSQWGSLVYQINLARSQRDLYSPNKLLIMQPQIQGVLKIQGNYFVGGVREPLNEEIQAEAMLSIAHGADGICWFTYYGQPTNFKAGSFEIMGLQNHDPANNYPHRHKNIYGQDKWKAVGDMNLKIEHWKPTLDEIHWLSGWSVHKDSASHEYISNIKSIYRNPSSPYAFSSVNEDGTKYWEEGFYNPDNSNDKSKYFIMVNRRCVPESYNGAGDIRQLKIKFDSTKLEGFRNWSIMDLDSNQLIRTFDKDSSLYIDMGIFQPGEDKLYKLAPVLQEAGLSSQMNPSQE